MGSVWLLMGDDCGESRYCDGNVLVVLNGIGWGRRLVRVCRFFVVNIAAETSVLHSDDHNLKDFHGN